jgi:hypothetical protein
MGAREFDGVARCAAAVPHVEFIIQQNEETDALCRPFLGSFSEGKLEGMGVATQIRRNRRPVARGCSRRCRRWNLVFWVTHAHTHTLTCTYPHSAAPCPCGRHRPVHVYATPECPSPSSRPPPALLPPFSRPSPARLSLLSPPTHPTVHTEPLPSPPPRTNGTATPQREFPGGRIKGVGRVVGHLPAPAPALPVRLHGRSRAGEPGGAAGEDAGECAGAPVLDGYGEQPADDGCRNEDGGGVGGDGGGGGGGGGRGGRGGRGGGAVGGGGFS